MSNLETLRQNNPLVVCYTNDVVKNFSANGLLSLGASPAMSEAPEEAADFFEVAGGLVINIGTITEGRAKDMLSIARTANQKGTPIVFDPVAVGASQYRKAFSAQFLDEIDVAVIKGNASEIQTLIDSETTMKGTESADDLDVVDIARKAQETFNTAIVVTGKDDVVAHQGQVIKLSNGSPMLAKITGAGCLLGAVVAAFLQRETNPDADTLVEAVSVYNIAAEHAQQRTNDQGPGSFLTALMDALYHISSDEVAQQIKKEVI